jgi:hypothetical protein
MNPQIESLKKEIESLKKEINLLKRSSTIPFDIEKSFRDRLGIDEVSYILSTSAKGAGTENSVVNEGGSSVYSVLTAPDGFLQTTISSTTYYIPIYI